MIRATKYRSLVVVLILACSFQYVFAQETNVWTGDRKKYRPDMIGNKFRIGVNVGILNYYGELTKGENMGFSTNHKFGYALSLERRVKNTWGFNMQLWGGKLAENGQLNNIGTNFQSRVVGGDLQVRYYLDNYAVFHRMQSKGSIYLLTGIGFVDLNSSADLEDLDGVEYNYWSDGTIRDMEESYDNTFISNEIERDHSYETPLEKGSTLYVPAGIGIDLKVLPMVRAGLFFQYNYTFTDKLDGLNEGGMNDAFSFFAFSLKYRVGGKRTLAPEEQLHKDVEFHLLTKEDSDGDGVADISDHCANTPDTLHDKIDDRGCPVDTDKDGVPDLIEAEHGSLTGHVHQHNGRTVSDAEIEAMWYAYSHSMDLSWEMINEQVAGMYFVKVEHRSNEIQEPKKRKRTITFVTREPYTTYTIEIEE